MVNYVQYWKLICVNEEYNEYYIVIFLQLTQFYAVGTVLKKIPVIINFLLDGIYITLNIFS